MAQQQLDAKEIENILRENLHLDGSQNILAFVHAHSVGPVSGGPEAIAAAILAVSQTLVMPAFTYQTQIIPQEGPPNNDMQYGTGDSINARAEFFRPDLAVHPDIGSVAEAFRKARGTVRSTHPIYSFIAQGPDARRVLASQTHQNPLGPIAWLEAHEGHVLLMGRDQRHNFTLHLAEQRAGRRTYIRWALTPDDIEELHHIPGSMEGFNQIWQELQDMTLVTGVGMARTELIPMRLMLAHAEQRIKEDPLFMLK